MISKRLAAELTGLQTLPVLSSRPRFRNLSRKGFFFLCHEGAGLTLRKIVEGRRRMHLETHAVGGKVEGRYDAVSYDAGRHFYVSDETTAGEPWRHPFSYDRYRAGRAVCASARTRDVPHGLFAFGCGSYPRMYVLPEFSGYARLCAVDYNDLLLERMSGTFDATCNHIEEALGMWGAAREPVALICAYHSDHAAMATTLFEANPAGYVFVEKPPAVTLDDLNSLVELYRHGCRLEIGFNRRYTHFARQAKGLLGNEPKMISIIVDETPITGAHWYQWPNQGTRITGNLCHWIDLCQYFVDAVPTHMTVQSSTADPDDVTVSVGYQDGSLASIVATSRGSTMRGVQEHIEIRSAGLSITIDDFQRMAVFDTSGARRTRRAWLRDKGHAQMYRTFRANIEGGRFAAHYPVRDLILTSYLTIAASRLAASGATALSLTSDTALPDMLARSGV